MNDSYYPNIDMLKTKKGNKTMKTLLVGLLSALVCTGVLIGNSRLARHAREQASQDYQIAHAKAACAQQEPYYSKRLASYALASSALADLTVNASVAKVRIALAALMTQNGWTLIDQSQTEPAFELFILPGARHFVQMDEPEQVVRSILSTPTTESSTTGRG